MSSRNLRQSEGVRYLDSYGTAPLKKKSTRKRLPEGRKNAEENIRLPDLNNPSQDFEDRETAELSATPRIQRSR